MSKVLKTIGTIAAAVATIAAIAGNPVVAAAATAVAAVANVGAQVTAKKPAAKGAVNTVLIQSDAPSPYLIGRTFFGGVLRHDVGYGGKVGKVQNPYRGMVLEYSVAGPVDALENVYADFIQVSFSGSAATGYYAGFMYRDFQLGARPEADALSPNWAGMPNWGASHKLSSKAAMLLSVKFDKDGKVFSSGVPSLGATWRGVKAYDPRDDSTYPGGDGPQRINDESTWLYSENPGVHALTYCLGRYVNGKKVFGIGLPADGLVIEDFVAFANVCDANNWKVGGMLFEPGDRWQNLKDILQAGSAEPAFTGGKVGLKYDAPRVSLFTITGDDLADGRLSAKAMQTWRDRKNTIIPKYRSENHKWEYVPSEAVSIPAYVTQDGEEKIEERQYNLVQQKNQAAQLARYELENGREIWPIVLPCKPEFRFYRAGDMGTIDIPELDLVDQDVVIVSKSIDPQTFAVTLTFMGETFAKHASALGSTGTEPPLPVLVTPEARDDAAIINTPPNGYLQSLILNSYVAGVGGSPLTAEDVGADATIFIAAHSRVYADKTVAVDADSITGLSFATQYAVYYDSSLRANNEALTFFATTDGTLPYNSPTYPDRHFVGYITTPADGAAATSGGGGGPSGSGGGEILP